MTQNNTVHAEVLLLFVLISNSICFMLSPHLQCAVLRTGWRGGCFSARWRLLRRLLRSCGLPQTERRCSKPDSPIRVNISLLSLGFQLSELNGIVRTCDLLFQAMPRLMERVTLPFSCFSRYSSYLQRCVHEISVESSNSWSLTEPLDTSFWAYFSWFHCRAAGVLDWGHFLPLFFPDIPVFSFAILNHMCFVSGEGERPLYILRSLWYASNTAASISSLFG